MFPSDLAASMHSAVHTFNTSNSSNATTTTAVVSNSNGTDESGQHTASSFVRGRALMGLWRSKVGQVDSSASSLSWKRIL